MFMLSPRGIDHNKVIFINYQTSELQYNYYSYIQVGYIGDTRGFSGEILKGLDRRILPWKTKFDRSIPIIED